MLRKKKPSRPIAFRKFPVKGRKIAHYSGVLQSSPGFVHYLDCEHLGQDTNRLADRFYDSNRSTHRIGFWYVDRFLDPPTQHEIFNFEIDLGSHLIENFFNGFGEYRNYSLIQLASYIDECALYVVESLAATIETAEDYKVLCLSPESVEERKITKSMFYLEDGRIDLDQYWVLILENAYKNCPYKRRSDFVEGILLD